MKRGYGNAGFTIVELLIVVVVIAILASITIVAYSSITLQAHDATIKDTTSDIGKQLEITKVKAGTYPVSTTAIQQPNSPTSLDYLQLNSGAGYCATVSNDVVAYYIDNTSNNALPGPCPGDDVTVDARYQVKGLGWTVAQIPTILNGSINTTLDGHPVTLTGVTTGGTVNTSHIDGYNLTSANTRCLPVSTLDGTVCPISPTADMQIDANLTLTVTVNLTGTDFSSLSFLMSDVEDTDVTIRAYTASNAAVSSNSWRVISYESYNNYNATTGRYVATIPSDMPNLYTNNGTGVFFDEARPTYSASQNDDAMRLAFDYASLQQITRITVAFDSHSSGDWIQWGFAGVSK